MVLRNLPDVYISSALSLGHLMTENNQTTAGTTRPANAQPCYCCKMLKASAPFKRVVSRLLSEDPASPGADNLVQRLTERIMNPRVGGGPQAMKVHKMGGQVGHH